MIDWRDCGLILTGDVEDKVDHAWFGDFSLEGKVQILLCSFFWAWEGIFRNCSSFQNMIDFAHKGG